MPLDDEGKEENFNWNYEFSFEKLKSDDGRRIIAGYASNGDLDGDEQIMDMDSLKAASEGYFKNPIVKFMHDKSTIFRGAIGKVIPEFVDSSGMVHKTSFGKKPYLVVEISKSKALDDIWDMIQEGLYSGFSIGGKAKKTVKTFSKEVNKLVDRIFVKAWSETSIVDVPSANGSFFSVLKSQSMTEIPEQNNKTLPEFEKIELESFNKAIRKFEKVN